MFLSNFAYSLCVLVRLCLYLPLPYLGLLFFLSDCCFSPSFSVSLSLSVSVSLILSVSVSLSLSISLPLCLSGFLSLSHSVGFSLCVSCGSASLCPRPLQCLPRGVLDRLGLWEAASLPPLNTQVAPSSPCPRGSGAGSKEGHLEEKNPPPERQGLSSAVSLCVAMCVEGGQEALCLGEGESEGAANVCTLLAPAAEARK